MVELPVGRGGNDLRLFGEGAASVHDGDDGRDGLDGANAARVGNGEYDGRFPEGLGHQGGSSRAHTSRSGSPLRSRPPTPSTPGTPRGNGGPAGQPPDPTAILGLLAGLSPASYLRGLSAFAAAIQQPVAGGGKVSSKSAHPLHATISSTATSSAPAEININMGATMFDSRIKPPEAVVALLRNGHHVPLTLCTNRALREVAQANVKYVKVHNSRMERNTLLDVSQWPGEASMSVEDWRQGWRNFLVILEQAGSADTLRLWRDHFEALCAKDEIEDSFESILEFDIELRQAFFAGSRAGFSVGSVAYNQRFSEISTRILRRQLRSGERSRSLYHPYRSGRGDPSSQAAERTSSDRRGFTTVGRVLAPGPFQRAGSRTPGCSALNAAKLANRLLLLPLALRELPWTLTRPFATSQSVPITSLSLSFSVTQGISIWIMSVLSESLPDLAFRVKSWMPLSISFAPAGCH
jgi:hypothetical protein